MTAEVPDQASQLFEKAVALQELGKQVEALLWLERAVALAPEAAMMQYRFADALWVAGQSARAIGHYQAALIGMPTSHELLLDLARAQHACGLFDGAIAMSARAIATAPTSTAAHLQKGRSQLALERFGEAELSLRRATETDSGHFDAHFTHGLAAFRAGLLDETLGAFRRALQITPNESAHRNLVFASAFHPTMDDVAILAEARSWAQTYAEPFRERARPHGHDADPERKLRIGYVSPNFWDHCQALFMAPLLAAHDRTRQEIVCYASAKRSDKMTDLLRGRADAWHDVVGLDDMSLAERIRADRVDVLVDLTMHMSGSRLGVFARRPAPVQVAWLAYPGTTGMSQMDYRITDRYIDPPAQGSSDIDVPRIEVLPSYSERSIVMPDTFWCYDPLTTERQVSPLPASRGGGITFGCLNNFPEINPAVLKLWARALVAIERSRLVLRVPGRELRRRVLLELEQQGVDPARIEFVDTRPRATYLSTYERIDICLDTFPYNGHTTSLDALWMGVPVITRVGKTVVGRAGLCHAKNLGLTELVAYTDDQFVDIAVALAHDTDRLQALRLGLRDRMVRSPLMDAPRFARNLEAAYRLAWRAWCGRSGESV